MPVVTAGIGITRTTVTNEFMATFPRFVGGIQFWSVSGTPPYPGMGTEPLARPNVNGIALRQTGRRAAPFPLTAKVDIALPEGIHNAKLAQMALKGTVIGFTNDRAMQYSNYAVLDVRFPQFYRGRPNPVRVESAVGGLRTSGEPKFLMVTQFILQYSLGF